MQALNVLLDALRMKKDLVLSFITDDRPGLIEEISAVIERHSGNWMESRLSQLSGKFAGILHISMPEEHIPALETELQRLSDAAYSWLLEHTQATTNNSICHSLTIDLVGNDRPGIVHDVSERLLAMGLNIEDMHSRFEDAPMSSEILFRATIRISAEVEIDEEQLEQQLESLTNELMIEIQRE